MLTRESILAGTWFGGQRDQVLALLERAEKAEGEREVLYAGMEMAASTFVSRDLAHRALEVLNDPDLTIHDAVARASGAAAGGTRRMNLTSLNPKWLGLTRPDSGEQLEFDCPACGPKHRVTAVLLNPLDGKPGAPWLGKRVRGSDGEERVSPAWTREGDSFESLTLTPSILYPCWHGWVEDGAVVGVGDASHLMVQVIVRASDGQPVAECKPIALSPRQTARLRKEGGW